jgi:hypothetical protein
MPFETIVALVLIIIPFIVFALILAYGDYQTSHRHEN